MSETKKKKITLDLKGQSVESVVNQVNAKYGVNTSAIASSIKDTKLHYISTGVYALDFALLGGIVENRVTEIFGPYSSLKSTVSLSTASNFLERYEDGLVVYVDYEKTGVVDYAEKLGVDTSRFLIINPDSGEQGVDASTEMFKIDRPLLMIVDSIAAMTPTKEIEESMDEQLVGVHARMINKFMRKAISRMNVSLYDDAPRATLILLNQIREKIGVRYGNPETTPGGKGKEFACSVRIRLSSVGPSNRLREDTVVNGVSKKISYGQVVNFSIPKNKAGGKEFDEGSFTYFYRDYKGHRPFTFNNAETLFREGVFNQIISYEKGAYSFKNISYKMKNKFIEALEKDVSLQTAIYRKLMRAYLDKRTPDSSKKVKFKKKK